MREDELHAEHTKTLQRKSLTASAVHDTLLMEGETELERPWSALAWSGLAAGLTMGLSLVAQGALRAHLPDTSWRVLVTSLGYAIGFVAVTLGRQQLYTETTLTATLPVLHHRSQTTLLLALRLWIVVLAANLIGAWLFAWFAATSGAFGPELSLAFTEIGREGVSHGPSLAFIKGIFGGWIIALMVWLLPSADTAKPWVIGAMTYLIAAGELTHIIAGSLDVFFGIAAGEIDWFTYFRSYGVPVLLGNGIGGLVFVAGLNHSQVRASA